MLELLKSWARSAKRDILVLHLAGRDPRVPWYAKALAVATLAYALSPIDLIPDFIPVLGYLDDLIIVPAAILLTMLLVPPAVVAELREEASRRLADRLPGSRWGAVVVVSLWAVLAVALMKALSIRI
ncbi:MAG: YkvA family protein [Actinomycetota bacterium]